MRLVLVLADAELELAPVPSAERMPVLDTFYHWDLMASLPGGSRRGRGDIVHAALQLCQGSRLNHEGRLQVFVHTRGDRVITVGPRTDVHPNYVRFLQDMGSLLRGAAVPGFGIEVKDLRTLIREIGADLVVAMSPSGEDAPLEVVFRRAGSGTVTVLIGAFPEGDYASPAYELAEAKVSLGPRLMRVPEVTSMVLRAAEEKER